MSRMLALEEELQILQTLRHAREHEAGSALQQLILAYYNTLLDFSFSYVRSVDAAEDVLQIVFIRLWERRYEVDPARSLRAWLFLAVRNASLDFRRRLYAARKYEEQAVALHSSTPLLHHDEFELTQLDDAVQQAIAELPPRCREVYLLSRRGDLSYPEIAQVLGISLSTVKTQMGRAVRVLWEKAAPFLAIFLVAGR